ncbi:unknown [Odoribacter sp. CAG:788]|nr:unknown [Odoribacter sp. CAG:788]
MAGIGVHRLFFCAKFRVGGVFVDVPAVLEAAVVSYPEYRIIIVKNRIAKHFIRVRRIPKAEHHIFNALVDAGENFRKHKIVAEVTNVEVLR